MSKCAKRQRIYTRLPGGCPCIKMVIYTAALQDSQPNRLYTRLPGVNIKLLFARQPFQMSIQLYTRLPCVHIKSLFTRQPFKSQIGYIHGSRVSASNCYIHGSRSKANLDIYMAAVCLHEMVIYTAVVLEPNRLYTRLPCVLIK